MGPLFTLFSNPLPTPLLTRPLKNYFYRHFGVSEWARRDTLMSRDRNCRETFLVSQLSRSYPRRGGNLKEEKVPNFGGILGDNLGEGNCESKIVARHWGHNFCRETSRCLAGPSGHPEKPPIGTRKRGHYERGLFAGGSSRSSRFSKFSRISIGFFFVFHTLGVLLNL